MSTALGVRGRVRRRLACVVIAALALLSAPAPAAGRTVAFPPGKWDGRGLLTGGFSGHGTETTGTGTIRFDLDVSKGSAAGELRWRGTVRTQIPGGGSGTTNFTGDLQLSGSASVVAFEGPVRYSGVARASGLSIPFNGTAPAEGEFSPDHASCTRVTGDMAVGARQRHEAAGLASSMKVEFVALSATGPATGDLLREYELLVLDLAAAEDTKLTPQKILKLVQRVEALNSQIAGAAACAGPPEGFVNGMSDPIFAALFEALVRQSLEQADAFSAQELLSVLGTGIRAGAIGASSPTPDASATLLDEVETVLDAKLDDAIDAADNRSIVDIYVGATQAGLNELADKAQGALL